MLFCILVITPANALYAKSLTVKVDGLVVPLTVSPEISNGCAMIGIRDVFEKIGADVVWDIASKSVYVVKEDMRAVLTVGKDTAMINGVVYVLDAPPYISDDRVLVPLRVVSHAIGAEVNWKPDTDTIEILTGKKLLSVISIDNPMTDNPVYVDYGKALADANAANSSLKDLAESVDLLDEMLKNAKDYKRDVTLYTNEKQRIADAARAVRKVEDQIANLPLNRQMIEESAEFMLRNSLAAIAGYEMDIQLVRENMLLQETNIKNLKLKQSLGMASESEITRAELELEQSGSNLEMLGVSLKNEKENLCKLLFKDQKREIMVNYELDAEPLRISSLESHIEKCKIKDPGILIKERAALYAKFELDTHEDEMDDTESLIEKENAHYSSLRAVRDAKADIEAAVRSAYNRLLQLEESVRYGEIDLQKTIENYNVMAANYQAGYLTAYELETARIGILKAEIELMKNEYSYWTLVYGFERPYLTAR